MPPVPAAPTVAVVGAGISGLAAAWALTAAPGAPRVVVLDAAPRVGGKLALAELDGVVVDTGAESLLARRPEAVDLARAVGLGDDLEPPRPVGARLWSRQALRPLPSGTLMGVPSTADGLTGVLTAVEVQRLLAEPAATWSRVEDDLDVAAFVSRRVGTAVVERLVEPLLGGVYAGHAGRLSLRATVPALWQAAVEGRSVVEAAAAAAAAGAATGTPVFTGIRGGVGRLPLALARAVRERGVELRCGATVRRLERLAGGWRVVHGPTTDERALDVDAVVLAVPAAPASRLLQAVAPAAAAAIGTTDYASVALVTLVLPRHGLPAALSGSGFLVPPVEGLVVKAATFSSTKWGWLDEAAGERVVLRASVGRHGEQRDLQRDDDDLVAAVLADLQHVLGPLPGAVASTVSRWGGALPQYAVGHLDRVAAARRDLAALAGLELAGAAYDGVGVPACIASGTGAALAVRTRLSRRPSSLGD